MGEIVITTKNPNEIAGEDAKVGDVIKQFNSGRLSIKIERTG